MLIAHVLTSIESLSSGPSYSVPRLCRALAAGGHDVALLTLGDPAAGAGAPYRDQRFAPDLAGFAPARRLGLSTGLVRGLGALEADVFHAHGLWMLPGVHAARAAAARGRPFVLSPRGMLGEAALAISPRRKRLFWALAQGPALRRLACVHATAPSEYREVRAFGIRAPVAVIPNGIDLPALLPKKPEGSRTVLSLGRLHPKKGLDRLIGAWARIEPAFPGWRLRIVGPSERGHAGELRSLAGALGLRSVEIAGEVGGEARTRLLAEAELFVLPSLNENFAMTVAESLACATPVISTVGAPWSGLEREGCGWWIEHGVEPLAAALARALALAPERRRAMGLRGRHWMERDFRWEAVGEQMAALYRWLAAGGAPPPSVRLD